MHVNVEERGRGLKRKGERGGETHDDKKKNKGRKQEKLLYTYAWYNTHYS